MFTFTRCFHIYQVDNAEEQHLTFTIPITDKELPTQYLIHCLNDRWLGADVTEPVDFRDIVRPESKSKHTGYFFIIGSLAPQSLLGFGLQITREFSYLS